MRQFTPRELANVALTAADEAHLPAVVSQLHAIAVSNTLRMREEYGRAPEPVTMEDILGAIDAMPRRRVHPGFALLVASEFLTNMQPTREAMQAALTVLSLVANRVGAEEVAK